MNHQPFSILITGLGGQGVVTLSKALTRAAAQTFLHVCSTENRGMSQRGGAVRCDLRFGPRPISSVISSGGADLILSLDFLESARLISMLAPSGILISDRRIVLPASHAELSPVTNRIHSQLHERENVCVLDFDYLLPQRLWKFRNAALLGAACAYLPINSAVIRTELLRAVAPDSQPENTEAFNHGSLIQATESLKHLEVAS